MKKIAIIFLIIGAMLVGSYGFLWLWGAYQSGFIQGWWTSWLLPHYVFTTSLVLGLLLLGTGIIMSIANRNKRK
jgi:hypothetical protein